MRIIYIGVANSKSTSDRKVCDRFVSTPSVCLSEKEIKIIKFDYQN